MEQRCKSPNLKETQLSSMYFDILKQAKLKRPNTGADINSAEKFQHALESEYQKELAEHREARLKDEERRARRDLRERARKKERNSDGSDDSLPFFMKDATIRAARKHRSGNKEKKSHKKKHKKKKKDK